MRGEQRSGLLLFEHGLCVCMHVCLLNITMTCAKTAELIEMLFVAWTRVGPRQGCSGAGTRGDGVPSLFSTGDASPTPLTFLD